MLINLTAIIALNQPVYFILNLVEILSLADRGPILWINPFLTFNLCVNPLLFDQVALEESIVEFYLS